MTNNTGFDHQRFILAVRLKRLFRMQKGVTKVFFSFGFINTIVILEIVCEKHFCILFLTSLRSKIFKNVYWDILDILIYIYYFYFNLNFSHSLTSISIYIENRRFLEKVSWLSINYRHNKMRIYRSYNTGSLSSSTIDS